MYKDETRRQRYQKQVAHMDVDFQQFAPTFRELSDFFSPRRARFYTSDVNRGDRRNQKILNCDPVLAVKILRAGMMGGITSKSREWFKYTTSDPKMAGVGSVKKWCYEVSEIIRAIMARSNFYNMVNLLYGDLGVYGTAPISIEENMDRVIHCQSFPVGSYRIATNEFGRVNSFAREYKMTVRQVVHKFGMKDGDPDRIDWSNISDFVKSAWEDGNYEYWVGISHLIQPNDMHDPDGAKIDSKYARFSSCIWETGSSTGGSGAYDSTKGFLKEKGFKRFPILCPRWEVTGEDSWGTDSPGMSSISDNKQLQYGEQRAAEVIEKKVRPPMVGPTSLRTAMVNTLPGGVTWVDSTSGSQKFEPAFNVVQDIRELEEKQRQIEQRIDRCFFVDLFRETAMLEDRQRTAQEWIQRREERLVQVGPVIEQLDNDLLDPAMDLLFDYAMDQRLLPPPPKELQGHELKLEYLSTMHLAQKALGVGTIERFAGFVGQVAAFDQTVLRTVKTDKMVDVYGSDLGINPEIMRTEEEREAIDAEMHRQQQQADIAARLEQGANTAKTLSEANTDQPSALKQLTDQGNAGNLFRSASA